MEPRNARFKSHAINTSILSFQNFIVFPDLKGAASLILKINASLGIQSDSTYAKPIRNWKLGEFAIPVTDELQSKCQQLISPFEIQTQEELFTKGWYFGKFEGPLAREREKLDQLYFIWDAIQEANKTPNFPAFLALVQGFLNVCYGIRESLKMSAKHFGSSHHNPSSLAKFYQWPNKQGEILKIYLDYYHQEKHGGFSKKGKSLTLTSQYFMHSLVVSKAEYTRGSSIEVSGDGPFIVVSKGTPHERRVLASNQEGVMRFIAKSKHPFRHRGLELKTASITDHLELILEFVARGIYELEKSILIGMKNPSSS